MERITKLGKNTYLSGLYQIRDLEAINWATPIDCPTVFQAKGAAIRSGNWDFCTAINTPESLIKAMEKQPVYDCLTMLEDTDRYELGGLIYAIATLNSAWGVCNGGNHGTSKGLDITNKTAAQEILKTLEPMVQRANLLIQKIEEL